MEKLKYIESGFYGEWVTVKLENDEEITVDLITLEDSDYIYRGHFVVNNQTYLLYKHLEYCATLVIEILPVTA